MPAIFALLCVSNLAAGTAITAVSSIFAAVRNCARAGGVTGAMVFDGAGFCLLLEGDPDAVLRCFKHCDADSRQAEFAEAYRGYQARGYRNFVSGYSTTDGLPPSEQLRGLDGEAALQRFLQLAVDFDLIP